jgi:hypothetical protein
VYRGTIPTGNTLSYLDGLYDLYIFDEKNLQDDPMDRTMAMIQKFSIKYGRLISLVFLEKVWENTHSQSSLRKYSGHMLLY